MGLIGALKGFVRLTRRPQKRTASRELSDEHHGHTAATEPRDAGVKPSPEMYAEKAAGCARGLAADKRARLRDMKVFVLDNSIRESTVGQDRGHTLADKLGIFEAVKSCGFKHIVLGVLNARRQVDDDFVRMLQDAEHDETTHFYAFTDPADAVDAVGKLVVEPGREPIALRKMVEYTRLGWARLLTLS